MVYPLPNSRTPLKVPKIDNLISNQLLPTNRVSKGPTKNCTGLCQEKYQQSRFSIIIIILLCLYVVKVVPNYSSRLVLLVVLHQNSKHNSILKVLVILLIVLHQPPKLASYSLVLY